MSSIHAGNKIKFAIIPCAGTATRMDRIKIPKSLYPINGKPALTHLLESLTDYFSYFYIPIANKVDEEAIYRKAIPKELLNKILFLPSIPGSGDGQAVLDALEIIDNKINSYVMVCWGDSFIKDKSLIPLLINNIENKFTDDFIVPLKESKDPYVCYLKDDKDDLKRVAFKRRGEKFSKGLTDMSLFFIKPSKVRSHLKDLREKGLKIKANPNSKNELNFLDLIEHLYKLKSPAKAFNVKVSEGISSFNTKSEAKDISDDLGY